ncbi:MAG: DegV family EDD domain-containing protein [Clostridia bacterium]|nr:DegV family EDD domain-containing protein [Clostridia bacterium]
MAFRIVCDSSVNMHQMPEADFVSVPMKILSGMREFVDDASLDVEGMCNVLEKSKERSGTSCPNIAEWKNAFEGADEVLAITISGKLSGSFSSCSQAMTEFLEEHPGAKGFVFDSLSTGPMMRMLANLAMLMKRENMDFDSMIRDLQIYRSHAGLIFTLASMNNLARNGRVSPAIAAAAGLLGIRLVAIGDENGTIKQVAKCRGEGKLPRVILEQMEERGYEGGFVRLDHCLNLPLAHAIRDKILEKYPQAVIEIGECTGLCAYYAERGGVIIGYEDRDIVR